jgi:hypothetical protein
MKKALISIAFFVFIVSPGLANGPRPNLLPFQKQVILDVLGRIRSHKEELAAAKKRMDDLYNGKAAVDALKEEAEGRESGLYQIKAYPVNQALSDAKRQISISLNGARGYASVLVNFKHDKVTFNNEMKMEYYTTKNYYSLSSLKKTEDKVFSPINSVEYEHVLYVKYSLLV